MPALCRKTARGGDQTMYEYEELTRMREIFTNAVRKLAVKTLPFLVEIDMSTIEGLPLENIRNAIPEGYDGCLMINIKSLTTCDIYAVGQTVALAENVKITDAEFINLLDKGEL